VTRVPASARPRVGEAVGGYLIESEIGRGGQAVVYRAWRLRTGEAVALRVLPLGPAADAAVLAAGVEHPNVVRIRETFERDGARYLAIDLVEGGSLADLVRREGPLAAPRALAVLRQVADALDHLAARDIVHRDLTPANVLLGPEDRVRLTDFGPVPAPGTWTGTAEYLAPEQIRGLPATPASDRYALAAMAQEVLTGHPPFAARDREATLAAHLGEPPPPASRVRPGLPPAVDAVLARGLAKDPDARDPSAGAFVDALAAALP
jgi:serine/threonine-protein kinase